MEISKPDHTKLLEALKRFQAEDGLEYETMIKGQLDQESFYKVVRYLQAHAESRLPDTKTLDIRVEHIPELVDARYHITGDDAILTYARTNKVGGGAGTADIKPKTPEMAHMMADYGVKWVLRREQPLTAEATAPLIAAIEDPAVLKQYRFKLRCSFLIADGALRVDATAVKQKPKLAQNLKASGVLQTQETYEIEVEAVKGASVEPDTLLATWTTFLAKLICLIRNQPVLLRQQDTDAVLDGYLHLAYPQKTPSPAAARERPKSYFLAPRITVLKLKHIIEPDIDTISIYKDYTVTDKADGEHALLFVDSAGKIYLINDRLRVTYTGLRHKTERLSIYDGELITRGRHGTRLQLFALFDAFYVNGRGIWEQPLMSLQGSTADTRLGAASAFVDAGVDRTAAAVDLTFQVKPFYAGNGPDMAAAVKRILGDIDSGRYPYETDGLVFTPIAMPPPLYEKGQTWNETFKWKPAKDNTIDFHVEYDRAADPIFVDNRAYIVAHLYVTFKPYYDAVDPVEILSGRPPKAAHIIEKKLFTTCYLALEDDLRTTLTVEREPIRSGMVVEFAYDAAQARETLRWVPKRVRHDKNQLAADTQRLQANAWKTAVDTMDSIQNPVSIEDITRDKPLSRQDYLDDNVYYARSESRRDLSILKPLREFHNRWVKERSLLMRFKGRAQSLLDLGVGQGGDLHKWSNAGFSMVVGVDAAADGILKGEQGAYDRLRREVEMGKTDMRRMRRLFLVLDMGKPWTPEYVQQSHEATRYLAQIAFGIGVKRDRIPERSLQPFYQVMRDGFDVVSCQFAVHYMFGSAATLEAFCGNLVRHMKPGGYFIGTTLDGAEVKRALRGLSRGQWIEWVDKEQVIWRIVKEYEGDGGDTRLGQRITNYMQSIGQQITEYLVDFDYMCEILARYGIVPLTPAEQHELGVTSSSGLFRELFRELQDAAARGQADHVALQSALQMNDAMRQYSFLNRWFIFRRSL